MRSVVKSSVLRWQIYGLCATNKLSVLALTMLMVGCSEGPPANQGKAITALEKSCSVTYELDKSGNVATLKINSPTLTDELTAPIEEFTELTQLNLKQTGITDEALQHIGKLGKLRTLYLDEVAITGAGLRQLVECKNLEELTLADCPVDDEAAAVIAGFPALRLLDLSRTKISDQAIASLGSLSNLQVIYLTETAVTGDGVAELKGLDNLQLMDLSGIPVDKNVVETLANYAELDRLYLGDSSLGDDLLPSLIDTLITSNKKLRGLAIPNVPLTNASIEQLKRLKELPELALVDLRNTQITKDAFRELTQAVTEVNFTADYPIED